MEIAGQITAAGTGYAPVPGLLVTLLDTAGGGRAAQADRLGEFDFTAPVDGPCGLVIGPDEGPPCVLVWESERIPDGPRC